MYFEAADNAQILVATCETLGVPRKRLFQEAGIDPASLEPPALHIAWPDLKRLLEAGERLTGDPAFALHTDISTLAPQWGVVGQFILAQRTTRLAVKEGLRMTAVMTNLIRFVLEERNGEGLFQTHFAPVEPVLRHIGDLYLLFQLAFNRHMLVRVWHPEEVRLRDRPVPLSEYERIFGCPVHMGWPHDEIVVKASHLDEMRTTYDPSTVELLRPHYDATVAAMSQNLGTTLWVTAVLESALLAGSLPTLAEFARRFRTSVRTLGARLEGERTSYRQVLDGVRTRHACLLLSNPNTKIEAVAAQLGYSADATFVRAFRRWTGMTPAEWRMERGAIPATPRNPS